MSSVLSNDALQAGASSVISSSIVTPSGEPLPQCCAACFISLTLTTDHSLTALPLLHVTSRPRRLTRMSVMPHQHIDISTTMHGTTTYYNQKPKQTYRTAYPCQQHTYDNHVTLIFDLLTSRSMHPEVLPCEPSLVLIA